MRGDWGDTRSQPVHQRERPPPAGRPRPHRHQDPHRAPPRRIRRLHQEPRPQRSGTVVIVCHRRLPSLFVFVVRRGHHWSSSTVVIVIVCHSSLFVFVVRRGHHWSSSTVVIVIVCHRRCRHRPSLFVIVVFRRSSSTSSSFSVVRRHLVTLVGSRQLLFLSCSNILFIQDSDFIYNTVFVGSINMLKTAISTIIFLRERISVILFLISVASIL